MLSEHCPRPKAGSTLLGEKRLDLVIPVVVEA
jgi:hypothetical protein